MNVKDWNQYAARLATKIGTELIKAHRGVILLPDHRYYAVFGNDGYGQDEKSRREVEVFRRRTFSGERDREEVAFATSEDFPRIEGAEGYTWVLIMREKGEESPGVTSVIAKAIAETLWVSWYEANDCVWDYENTDAFAAQQMRIATSAIAEFSEKFDYSTLN